MALEIYLKRWDQPRGWEIYQDDRVDNDQNFDYVEINSEQYPDHLFKIGYFRSGYNDMGINHKLRPIIGLDLYSIFNPPCLEDNYHFQPDWQLAKSITEKAILDLKIYIEKSGYGVEKIVESPFKKAKFKSSICSEAHALRRFQEVQEAHNLGLKRGNFTTKEGHFLFKEPLTVVGVLQGCSETILGENSDCQYLIYKDESLFWYLESLEIVKETCCWVLARPDIDYYCLAWTG